MNPFSGKVAFVDGSVNLNNSSVHSRGSAAAVVLVVEEGLVAEIRILSQYKEGYDLVTNNTMELMAISSAFMLVGKEIKFYLWSDSQYALGCIFGNYKGQKNTKLIKAIKNFSSVFKVSAIAQHISGHKGWFMNEAADYIARETVECRRSIKFQYKPKQLPLACALCTRFQGCIDMSTDNNFHKTSWMNMLKVLKTVEMEECQWVNPYVVFPERNRPNTSCAGIMVS